MSARRTEVEYTLLKIDKLQRTLRLAEILLC